MMNEKEHLEYLKQKREENLKALKEGRTELDLSKLTTEEQAEYWRIDELMFGNVGFLPTTGEIKKLIWLEEKMDVTK